MKSSRNGGTTPALVAGSLAFLIGGGAFMATRGHRHDTDKLPELLEAYWASNEVLFTQMNVDLPQNLKNTSKLMQAPVIVIDDELVHIEGNVVLKISDVGSMEGDTLPELSAHLKNLEDNFNKLHPDKELEGTVILQADKEASTVVVRKVLRTCAGGKYRNIQIPTIDQEVFRTSVLGELRPVRSRSGVRFQLFSTEEPGSLVLIDEENFDQLARRIDQAAANPPVKVRL
jgi:biopolymer transport protein ExbD